MNKMRSVVGVAITAQLMVWSTVGIGIAAYSLRHKHREHKAMEMCVNSGISTEQCTAQVAEMSEDAILAYIRDDKPTGGNGGNFVGGYMNP